jgi:hypothetical protein
VYALIYVLTEGSPLRPSDHPYWVYLANAFLHGQLSLVDVPPLNLDLILYDGRYYLYWPPFPAVVYLPVVAVFGPHVSDVPLSLVVAGLNVALVALLFLGMERRGLTRLTADRRAWLVAGFACGSVHLFLGSTPSVHYTSQLIGFGVCCAAYVALLWAPSRWAPVLCGALLGCAFLTRSPLLAAGIWVGWMLWLYRDRTDWRSAARIAVSGLLPLGLAVALLGLYNYLRFGRPLDMGYAYHDMEAHFVADYQQYGPFSLHYLPINFFYNFVTIPYLAIFGPDPKLHFWMGGSLFLMSPVFFLAIPGLVRSWRSHGWALAVSMLLGLVPMLLLMGTGYATVGPRYTLDVTVPLLVATAIGAAGAPTRLIAYLNIIGVVMYLPGTILFHTARLSS